MRKLFQFIVGALLTLLCSLASAQVPVGTWETGWETSPSSAGQWWISNNRPDAVIVNFQIVDTNTNGGTTMSRGKFWLCTKTNPRYVASEGMCYPEPPTQCEGGRERDASGQCACKAGTKEPPSGVGACVPETPKDPVCGPLAGGQIGVPIYADYGNAGSGLLGRMVGNSSSTCFPGGCEVSGTVAGCYMAGGGASCELTSVTFTGNKCDDSQKPGACPSGTTQSEYAAGVCVPNEGSCAAGSTPSKYAEGVCIPDANPCPSGQSPSKYAQGVCVPNESSDASGNGETGKPSTCPKGQVPSKYAQGVCLPAEGTVGTGGAGVVCKDGKCTTTNPDGSTDEKPQDSFCKENPSSPMCKEGKFGGSCSAGFTCEGDAAMCAIAKEQHKQNCKLLDENTPDTDYAAAAGGTDEKSADALKSSAAQVSVSQLDQNGFGWARSCPADLSFEIPGTGKTFDIPFSKVCPVMNIFALAVLGMTLLACVLWVVGKKE